MEVIEYVEKIDDRMNRINKNYKYISEYIHNYLNDGKIEYEQLMDFELSLQDLSIQINKLVFLFNQIENNENNKNNQNNENPNLINVILQINNNINQVKYNNNEKINKMDKMDKIDYALDKTIFHFLPLLFMYFMIFDNESILYIKDFIDKKNNNSHYSYINNTNNNNTNNNNTTINNITKEEIIMDLD